MRHAVRFSRIVSGVTRHSGALDKYPSLPFRPLPYSQPFPPVSLPLISARWILAAKRIFVQSTAKSLQICYEFHPRAEDAHSWECCDKKILVLDISGRPDFHCNGKIIFNNFGLELGCPLDFAHPSCATVLEWSCLWLARHAVRFSRMVGCLSVVRRPTTRRPGVSWAMATQCSECGNWGRAPACIYNTHRH